MWQLSKETPKLMLGSILPDFPGAVGLLAAQGGLAQVGIETSRIYVEDFSNHAEYEEALKAFLDTGSYTPELPELIDVEVSDADRARENTGEALLKLLERRLDNVVCKSGLAPSRKSARVMIGHGHIYVNGRRLDRPGYRVNQGDQISIKPSDRSRKLAKTFLDLTEYITPQPWLQVDRDKFEVTVAALPSRDDVQIPVEVQLIVEMCSR